MEKITVDDMKRIELEIMDEFDRICRENGLSYCIGYGSCLGAIRHGGFIPWDDDMDVIMPRADYERFIERFSEMNQVDRYSLATYRDKSGIYPFVKMVDTTTKVLENFAAKKYSTGVWIDIFPLDTIAPDDLKTYSRGARIGLTRSLIIADPSFGSTAFVRLVKRITNPVFSRMDPYKAARKIDENARNACLCETGYVADIVGANDADHIFPLEIFEPVEVDFEDRRYFAPRGYETYLSTVYGDWKTPPAEDDRDIHVYEAYRL